MCSASSRVTLSNPSHFTDDPQARSDAAILSGVRKLLIINLTTRYLSPRAYSPMCVFAALKQKIVALGGVAWYRRNVDVEEEGERCVPGLFSAVGDRPTGGRQGKETVMRSIRGGDQLNRDPPRADAILAEIPLADIISLLVAINRCR